MGTTIFTFVRAHRIHVPRMRETKSAPSEAADFKESVYSEAARRFFDECVSRGKISGVVLNPFRTAVPVWGQSSQTVSTSSPERDCSPQSILVHNICLHTIIVVFTYRVHDLPPDMIKTQSETSKSKEYEWGESW